MSIFGAMHVLVLAAAVMGADSTPTLRVRNHHAFVYAGPLQFTSALPDGTYQGSAGSGEIRDGKARVVVSLDARSDAVLRRVEPAHAFARQNGPFSVTNRDAQIDLRWLNERLGSLDFGLIVLPGTSGTADQVAGSFQPLPIAWTRQPDGTLSGQLDQAGFRVEITLVVSAGGWLDAHARLTPRTMAAPAYVALVRRISTAGIDAGQLRFNGRVLEGTNSPENWERDFWYTHGVDWISWKTNKVTLTALSGFTPAPPVLRDGAWVEASSFFVWEKTRRQGNSLYLISQVSGPNLHQKVNAYAPVHLGDTLDLRYRIAIDEKPSATWPESQLRVFAGYRNARLESGVEILDLGVPAVVFGTSYFPYSTFVENFDYYRTPGLDSETWWPFSAQMWRRWRAFVPRMQTDLHIIRAMGFEMVRLHHLELLQQMERAEALAFLDWFTGAARTLDLGIMVDTEGPRDWLSLLAGRYGDFISRYELENEILIFGVKPGDAQRWTEQYHAIKEADPDADVFLTNSGNHGMFERLRTLGVPFDRVGLHAYKHGPEWKEAFATHALATGGYATDIGKPATLGEFNWKSLTRLSPEARRAEFATIYGLMLEARAIPEFYQFHWQETMSVNPAIGRSGIRHYETISLDRRPKPEALELMRLIREYARPDASARELPVRIDDTQFAAGSASVSFTIANKTTRPLTLGLGAVAFEGMTARVASARDVTIEPGSSHTGQIELQLQPGTQPGTYHYFLVAKYDGRTAYGWGIAANPGAPAFTKQSVVQGVMYPQGRDIVNRINWSYPLYVTFGADAPVVELEMAYMVGNTLQSATGRPVRISSTADLPATAHERGTVILVGTPISNPLVASAIGNTEATHPLVFLRDHAGGQQVALTGTNARAAQAAATDFVLRYWQGARDAAIRVTGMEPGAALGRRLGVAKKELP